MHQQINFFQGGVGTEQQIFGATTLLMGGGVIVLAMVLTYVFALHKQSSIASELQLVSDQETAALERLQNVRPAMAAASGDKNWSEQLDDATRSLAEKELVFSLLRGTTLGDIQGFSRYLKSLALQDTDGLWLTHISLSALGDKTRLEGQALRAELVPAYLQKLAEEPPFATQRFNQFQIDGPEEATTGGFVTFSMYSEAQLVADVAESR